MSQLILSLPFPTSADSAAAIEFDYWLTLDGRHDVQQGRTTAALLPADRGRASEVVAVLPAHVVAWHPVLLPGPVARSVLGSRPDPQRVRAVLAGILEDQLLDDPAQLHFAVFPGFASGQPETTDGGVPVWVAVCAAAPLRMVLRTLEAAGRAVTRLVVDGVPLAGPDSRVVVTGTPGDATLMVANQRGVCCLPLQHDSVTWVMAQGRFALFAEPPVLELAEQALGQRGDLQSAGERLLASVLSDWNLAQGELSPSQRGRWLRHLAQGWRVFAQRSTWRPVRWGVVALLVLQVVALNVLAWQKRSAIQQRQEAVRAVLTDTFPETPLVVDAPVQMRRALESLARARGAGSAAGAPELGRVLAAMATLDSELVISAIDLEGGRLSIRAPLLQDPAHARKLVSGLVSQGWRVTLQDAALLVQSGEGR